jgi:hypothetical protein
MWKALARQRTSRVFADEGIAAAIVDVKRNVKERKSGRKYWGL